VPYRLFVAHRNGHHRQVWKIVLDLGGTVRDGVRVALVFFGSVVFCAAAAATADAVINTGHATNGPSIGGVVAGVGLGFMLIALLRD
jgi:hypothetical protein